MPKLRRWHCRLIVAVVALGAGVGGLAWWAAEQRAEGARELARVRAELDATDPGWRYADLCAARNAALPSDGENGMRIVEEVAGRGKTFEQWRDRMGWYGRDPDGRPDPAKLDAARAVWKDSLDDIRLARQLRDRPRGGGPQAVPTSPLTAVGTNALVPLSVARLLHFDALVSALDGDPNQAVASLHACLHVGRVAGADGTVMGALARTACSAQAEDGLRRVLAWSEPTAGLAELQAALAEEAAGAWWAEPLRTERAWVEFTFEAMENGTLTTRQLIGPGGTPLVGRSVVDLLRYPPHRTADHACALETMTRYIEATRRPVHEWKGAAAAIPVQSGYERLISASLTDTHPRLISEAVGRIAAVRVALAALACERFRRANGRWPTALAELPDLPPELRLDPHDGKPLRLRKLDDGLVVYSVGPDGADDGGKLKNEKGEKGTLDVGFRLWDAEKRKP